MPEPDDSSVETIDIEGVSEYLAQTEVVFAVLFGSHARGTADESSDVDITLWTVANILRAEETGEALSEGKQLTAGELMQAIEDDPRDLQIPTELTEPR
jgi:predicted nucleotidyltransferase